jgi:hypothetical protein
MNERSTINDRLRDCTYHLIFRLGKEESEDQLYEIEPPIPTDVCEYLLHV